MAGGSATPENPTDQRCEHCALFYSSQGITTHEPNCAIADLDVDVVPVAQSDDETETLSESPTADVEPADGIEAGDSPAATSGTDGPATATDGGTAGLGLEGPPEQSSAAARDVDDQDVQDDDDDDVQDTYDCTKCGADLGYDDDDLRDHFGADGEGDIVCDCGHRMRWSDE